MGDSLLQMALEKPDTNFIGIEVHKPGVGKLLHGIAEHGVSNLRIICHDAKEVLAQGFDDGSIDQIQIFFPDPWHKKRHNKRRLVQQEFMLLIANKLKETGSVHLATDWQEYAVHMMEVMSGLDAYTNTQGEAAYWLDPDRPNTKFERRGQKLGHGVWDLLFTRAD